jgi:hypothetical protein
VSDNALRYYGGIFDGPENALFLAQPLLGSGEGLRIALQVAKKMRALFLVV